MQTETGGRMMEGYPQERCMESAARDKRKDEAEMQMLDGRSGEQEME